MKPPDTASSCSRNDRRQTQPEQASLGPHVIADYISRTDFVTGTGQSKVESGCICFTLAAQVVKNREEGLLIKRCW